MEAAAALSRLRENDSAAAALETHVAKNTSLDAVDELESDAFERILPEVVDSELLAVAAALEKPSKSPSAAGPALASADSSSPQEGLTKRCSFVDALVFMCRLPGLAVRSTSKGPL